MSGFNVNGPAPSGNPFPESTRIHTPALGGLKKAEEIASQELGVVGKNSRIQGKIKKIFTSHASKKLGKAVQEFADKIVQTFVEAKAILKTLSLKTRNELQNKSDSRLRNIVDEFKVVGKWISDFEEREKPLDLNDPDSIMLHQEHVAQVRQGLQQIRDQAEEFKDPSVKTDILNIADALMLRLDDLLTERFDGVEFFKGSAKVKQQPDEELAQYFDYEESKFEGDIEDLMRELEQIPEGEMPDGIPAAAKDPLEKLDQDLEGLKGPHTDPWEKWDYSEDDDKRT